MLKKSFRKALEILSVRQPFACHGPTSKQLVISIEW
jgi:hypothetical protein